MTKTLSINQNENQTIHSNETAALWNGKKITVLRKPLQVVLLIGLIASIGVAITGCLGYGTAYDWWFVEPFNYLTEFSSSLMIAIGISTSIVMVIVNNFVKSPTKNLKTPYRIEMIDKLEVHDIYDSKIQPGLKFRLCQFAFSNGEIRNVFLLEEELIALINAIDLEKISNETDVDLQLDGRLSVCQADEILSQLNRDIAKRWFDVEPVQQDVN